MRHKIGAYRRLGLPSLARVGLYRIGLRYGLHPVLRIASEPVSGPFFAPPEARPQGKLHRPERWEKTMPAFSAHEFALDGPPKWNASPFQPDLTLNADRPWHEIGDFSSGAADIKMVWEASRFDWAVSMAQRTALGDEGELERLNTWIDDWQDNCPPYYGPNWMCGQEASLRVLHLAAALLILRQENAPLPGLLDLAEQHLSRIAPTMGYARGQDNNHGTSEAAALLVGGSLLVASGRTHAAAWAAAGRQALEERVKHLIATDGSFSQYSVNYHRMMLDTLSLVEVWRRRIGLPAFSPAYTARARAAVQWLRQMADPGNGDAPNIGANDGALLIPLADAPYRDFRPSVQLAAALFCDGRAYSGEGIWNRSLAWLDVELPGDKLPALESVSFDDGGLHVLRAGVATAYLRYPRFRFRPGQADALHCDVWVNGRNVLRDAGSYSYASDKNAFYAGTAGHNTVQFDRRDQMPRISRFLFGKWLEAKAVMPVSSKGACVEAAAAYRDWKGARHHRKLKLCPDTLECHDILAGEFTEATIRWRLAPGEWHLTADGVRGDGFAIAIDASGQDIALSLTTQSESRQYLQESDIPVLEIHCSKPGRIVSTMSFACT